MRSNDMTPALGPLPEPPRPELVTEDVELRDLCERWGNCSALAIDTEFVRTRTFRARLGLVQVGDPERSVLLDAVAIRDWEPFWHLIRAPEVLKVLHSPGEDLEVFHTESGHYPDPIFDTQIAAALTGSGGLLGYSRLVDEFFEVELPKGQQRSNWLKRPLSASQIRYAGLDVAYLLPAREILTGRLEDLGRLGWFEEEMQRLIDAAESKMEPTVLFERLLRPRTDEHEAGALLELVRWREEQARQRDLPRKFVVPDELLREVARRRPDSISNLTRLESLTPALARRFGDELLARVDGAQPLDLEGYRLDWKKVGKSRLARVRAALDDISAELGIPSDFLASKKTMEQLVRRAEAGLSPPDLVPEALAGWRWTEFGSELLAAI